MCRDATPQNKASLFPTSGFVSHTSDETQTLKLEEADAYHRFQQTENEFYTFFIFAFEEMSREMKKEIHAAHTEVSD